MRALSVGRARRVTLAFLTIVFLTLALPVPHAHALAAATGVCVVTGQATYGPSGTMMPSESQDVSIDLSGDCLTNDGIDGGRLVADLSTTANDAFGCAGGAISGSGTFYGDMSGVNDPRVAVTVVGAGGALAAWVTGDSAVFAGAGAGVQSVYESGACASGGSVGTSTWTLAIAFGAAALE